MLETERLILRNYKESDLDDYFEYVSMEKVGPMCGWPPYNDKEKAFERLKLEITKKYQFAIVLKENNKVIGSLELMDVKEERYKGVSIEDSAKEIGFLLSEHYWGQGIMTEALKAVMRFAFLELNVPVIYISHVRANIGSGKVQEKCGFEVFNEVPNYRVWIDGTNTDLVERKMTRDQYLDKQL